MNLELQPNAAPTAQENYSVPWKPIDTWIGVVLLIVLNVGLLFLAQAGYMDRFAQSWLLIIVQLAYLLPVAIILGLRGVSWNSIGFGSFDWSTMGIGCGLLIVSYFIIAVHNIILTRLGFGTQGEEILELLSQLDSPLWFLVVGAVFAPVVEEIFFRGFLFQGLRAKHGWIRAMLSSSAIFGVAHLDPASLIPTFVLGNLLAYLYHRSNSVWPGVILHALVNTSNLLLLYFVAQNPQLIPS